MSNMKRARQPMPSKTSRRWDPRRDRADTLAHVTQDSGTSYSIEKQIAMEGEFFYQMAGRGGAWRFWSKLIVFAILLSPVLVMVIAVATD